MPRRVLVTLYTALLTCNTVTEHGAAPLGPGRLRIGERMPGSRARLGYYVAGGNVGGT